MCLLASLPYHRRPHVSQVSNDFIMALQLKEKGNALFSKKQYGEALDVYAEALQQLRGVSRPHERFRYNHMNV